MPSSSTTQTYSRMLASMDETIAMLATKRAQVLASYRESQLSDVLEQDAAWLADTKNTPPDWAYLLNTKTDGKKWRAAVSIEGVRGDSEWAYSDERAVTFKLYTEVPERMDLYAWLIQQIMPVMKPWNPSGVASDGSRFVSMYCEGGNLMLGQTSTGTWILAGRGGRNADTYPDLKSALKEAQNRVARSFFGDE